MLVDGRGVPLSITVTGANVHDVKELEAVLQGAVYKRARPPKRRIAHLCADKGYFGQPAMEVILSCGFIPHVVSRGEEVQDKQRTPSKKARRWVVEVSHGWFNRFRKLLVRYEKLHRSYMALTHLAAAIIAFRKVPMRVNIIYG